MSKILSICIPTFNRADLIDAALHSIENNLIDQESVEVIICDNASEDNTQEIVNTYCDRIPNFRYHRNSSNIGPVKNVRKVIELATGEFVWLFADDDVMAVGALAYLLRFLSDHSDVDYLFYTREVVDFDLKPTRIGVQPKGLNSDVIFSDGNGLFCGCDGQMPYFIGFYSSTIIRRQIWLDSASKVAVVSDDYAWDHLLIIFRAIRNGKCAILSKIGVLARLNYRQIQARSKGAFDDSIHCYLEIMKLGYSPGTCLKTIRDIIRKDSKGFVIDQANGIRDDTLLDFFIKYRLKRMIVYSLPWSFLSLLPQKILNILWRLYCWKFVKDVD